MTVHYEPKPESLVIPVQGDQEQIEHLNQRIAELEQKLKAQRALATMYQRFALALFDVLFNAVERTAKSLF